MRSRNLTQTPWVMSVAALAVLSATTAPIAAQTPLGTDFTYQGNLSSPGMPAVTTADLQFTLHDAQTDGAQIGAMLPKDNVALARGTFTLSLDFGPAAFNSDARWLQVSVRSPSGAGNFTTLSPRQRISATPFALKTRGIDGHSLDTADGSITDAVVVDDIGRVGIGTLTPGQDLFASTKLDVVGGSVAVSPSSGFLIKSSNGSNFGLGVGIFGGGDNSMRIVADGSERVRVGADGDVGIGTGSPLGRLHIKKEPVDLGGTLALEGSAHTYMTFFPDGAAAGRKGFFGFALPTSPDMTIANESPNGKVKISDSSGNLYPANSSEALRIVRGQVFSLGSISQGSGFTSERMEEGRYRITFDSPFSGIPVMTANIVTGGNDPTRFVEIMGHSNDVVTLQVIQRSNGDIVDGMFDFIAIGPR